MLSIKRTIASWVAAAVVILLVVQNQFYSKTFGNSFYLWGAVLIFAGFYAVCTCLTRKCSMGSADDFLLGGAIFLYGVLLTIKKPADFPFAVGVLAVFCIAGAYLMPQDRLHLERLRLSRTAALLCIGAAGLFAAGFVASIGVLRHWTYATPCFDFGIFVQMYHNMKETLLATVSCERDRILSHFAVHVSPIYYLLLPVYALFPYAETLQIAQAVVVYSAVIPLYLIARGRGMSCKGTAAICVAACFYPALAGGCMYDIHENCFLVPLILWMFYFWERKKRLPMFLLALLVLLVKEDAAIYVAFAGLFVMADERDYKSGLALLAMSIGYFLCSTWYLRTYGMGVMTTRYDNFIPKGGGLKDMLVYLFRNPALAIAESFNTDTLLFLLEMLLPAAFLPFATRRISRYTLLLPLMLMNLMPDYVYQHSIFYQYVFGSAAFILYASVLNLSDLTGAARRSLALLALCASLLSFNTLILDKDYYYSVYQAHRETYDALDEILETVPDDVSVKASTFLVPHLAQREVIFQMKSEHVTEYVAYDLRYDRKSAGEDVVERFEALGYETVEFREGIAAVFRMPDWDDSMADWLEEDA